MTQFVVSLCKGKCLQGLEAGHEPQGVQHPDQSANAFITSANTSREVRHDQKARCWRSVFGQEASPSSAAENGTTIVNFKLIPDCPDIIVFITSAETVNIWSLTEEVICRRVQLPNNFLEKPRGF